MREPVTVACAQVEPVLFDREATIGRLEEVAAEAAGKGAQLVLFPETFLPAYPTNRWVRYLAGGDGAAKHVFARLARESLEVPSAASERIGNAARASTGSGWRSARTSSTAARSTTRSCSTARTASSRCTTASSCRRTTSAWSGAPATAAGSGRSRPSSAASAA
jgi:predicted amidohydrolase